MDNIDNYPHELIFSHVKLMRTSEIFLDMPKVDETPELGEKADLIPPPVPSVPVAANVALKLPVLSRSMVCAS